jgi:hypothetical protein
MVFTRFRNVLKNPASRIVIAIVWGLGLATLFQKACKGRNCIIYKAPHLEDVKGKTFRFEGQCYQYTPRTVQCNKEKEVVTPEEFYCPMV